MRILAIRGENLASLAQRFEVELEQAPLTGTGLFVISGPTGAGKSTLLDALCLALFDAVPRLANSSSAPVGGDGEPEELRLAADDVRSVLTRGAGQGYSEVDFLGNDGRRYRARWEVRRARGRADGRYQPQTLTLLDLTDNQRLGRTRTEVLELIAERLGLTFEQFRRAVLLAQGDFAAFLKAKERERSELLERITGTEIYAQISRATFARANEESQALRELQAGLAAISPLEAGARAVLEQEVASTRSRFDAAARELDAARTAQTWCETQAGLALAAVQAEGTLATAAGALAEAAPRREVLRRVEAAEPLRAPIERADRTCGEHEVAVGQLAAARRGEGQAQARVEAQEATEASARLDRQAAERALQAARPDLETARRLDTRLTEGEKRLAQAREGARAAREASKTADEDLSARKARRASLVEDRDREAVWLQTYASLGPLAQDWAHWNVAIGRYATGLTEARAAEARLVGLSAEKAKAEADRDAARGSQAATASALQGAREALERTEADCAGYDLAALRAEETALVTRQKDLSTLAQCAREVRSKTATRDQLLTDAGALEAQAAEAGRLAQATGGEVDGKDPAIAEAKGARDRLLAASTQSAEELRSHLVPGDPCPVCGGLDHPWLAARPALRPLLQEATDRVQALERERTALVATQAGHETTARENRKQAEDRRANVRQGQAELAALTAQWTARHAGEGLPGDPLDAAVAGALAERLTEIDASLSQLRERLSAAIECQRRRDAAARMREEAREADDGAHEKLLALQARVQSIEQERALELQKLDAARSGLGVARATLATPFAPFADWEQALAADPVAFRRYYEARVGEWRRHEQARATADVGLVELSPRIAEAEATARAASEGAQRTAAEAEVQSGECQRLAGDRQALLGGRPADEVEAGLQARQGATLTAHQQAVTDLANARSDLAAAGASAQHWAGEASRKGAECVEARRVLEAALCAQALELEAARQLLSHAAAWVQAQRTALATLARAEQDARVLAAERRRQAQEHATTRSEGLDCAGVAAVLAGAQERHGQAQSTSAAAHGRRHEDDRRRQEADALAERLASQEARARLWDQLRDLIGSADGNKFRTFAQSLTLDALLAHANRHLEDLARRYRLERSPGSDLALQVVDRDMGDEVRSVYSLSGGESFLVSLALALGLASLASHRASVESLFIDEGFGSLDPETLDTAIASLDALQALGRKVGVISHVPTLVERIGVQVRVEPRGGGRSRVRTVSSEALAD